MPLTILVADDNLGTRLSVSDYLEMSGYSVMAAEDGLQALSMIETYHPHILITDINMPRMDGYELVRQVRQKPAFRLLPVVFLTERASTEERIRGYQTGCDLYLPKPFEMQELSAVIRNLLERSQIIQSEWRFSCDDVTPKLTDSDAAIANKQLSQPEIALTASNFNLTKREEQVLEFLTKGSSNVEIGNKLHLSPRTIEKYVSSLLRKTATSNRAELVRFAMEKKLVD